MIGWLDIVLAIIITVTVIIGLVKGLVRELIGVAAAVGGFILAGYNYQRVADLLGGIIHNPTAARFLGFILILIIGLAVGALLSFLLSKLLKGTIQVINHFLGGVFGCIEGLVIGGALVFGLLAFPVDQGAVSESRIAPYCYGLTKAIVSLVPAELKNAARTAYQSIFKAEKGHGQKN
ncbi:MAG: CvpA family protein [Candidatus Aminicenantales bacterium]